MGWPTTILIWLEKSASILHEKAMNKIETLLGERPNMQASNPLPTKRMGLKAHWIDYKSIEKATMSYLHLFLYFCYCNDWS